MATKHGLDTEGAVTCDASPRPDGSNVTSNPDLVSCGECKGEEFTVRDAVDWLGLTWDDYIAMNDVLRGIHGGPQIDAIMAVQWPAQRRATTPEQVLARCGIDPADPVAAAKAYRKQRGAYADGPLEFE